MSSNAHTCTHVHSLTCTHSCTPSCTHSHAHTLRDFRFSLWSREHILRLKEEGETARSKWISLSLTSLCRLCFCIFTLWNVSIGLVFEGFPNVQIFFCLYEHMQDFSLLFDVKFSTLPITFLVYFLLSLSSCFGRAVIGHELVWFLLFFSLIPLLL